jgi:surface protein
MEVRFYNISGPPGIAEGQLYYVLNAATNTFQISSTVGGSALSLNMGTGTLLPYKQVIVTITPQSGQLWASVELNSKHTKTGLQKYDSGFLDVIFNRVMSAVSIGSNSPTIYGTNITFNKLQRAQVLNCGFSNAGHMFAGCISLRSVVVTTVGVNTLTNTTGMFFNCISLTTVPLFNTGAVTNMSQMFSGCTSLATVPLFNTAAVTTMSSMFSSCGSLTSIPQLNMSGITLASNLSLFVVNATCPCLIDSDVFGTKVSVSYQGCKLSQNGLENIMNLLQKGTAQSLTISSNWGAPNPVSTSSTHTLNSKSVTVSSATGLTVGMQITGAGSALTNPVQYIWTADQGWIRRNAVGAVNYLQNGDIISFSSWTNGPSTGITTDVPYYVVGAGTNPDFPNAFRVSSTLGGTPISWSNAQAGNFVNIRYNRKITAISGNTITTDREWMGANITNSSTYRLLPTATALHKGWVVTG